MPDQPRAGHGLVPEQDVMLAHATLDELEMALFGDVKQRSRDTLVMRADRLRTLLDHFDRYASVEGDPTPYNGSPFQADVRKALRG